MGRPERVERSVADLPTLQSIAGGFGFVLEVKNQNQHWMFKRPGGARLSSAARWAMRLTADRGPVMTRAQWLRESKAHAIPR